MDNASKALIIAGAILIAVMLVSLGVMLYNTAAGVAETTIGSVEALGVQGFNAQFETFLGNGKSKSQASGLLSKIIANNANNDTTITPTLAGLTYTGTGAAAMKTAVDGAKNYRYNITAGYDNYGAISTITITAVSRTATGS